MLIAYHILANLFFKMSEVNYFSYLTLLHFIGFYIELAGFFTSYADFACTKETWCGSFCYLGVLLISGYLNFIMETRGLSVNFFFQVLTGIADIVSAMKSILLQSFIFPWLLLTSVSLCLPLHTCRYFSIFWLWY